MSSHFRSFAALKTQTQGLFVGLWLVYVKYVCCPLAYASTKKREISRNAKAKSGPNGRKIRNDMGRGVNETRGEYINT